MSCENATRSYVVVLGLSSVIHKSILLYIVKKKSMQAILLTKYIYNKNVEYALNSLAFSNLV